MRFWDVDAPRLSEQSPHRWRWDCRTYAPAGRGLLPGRFLTVISVRGLVDPKAIMRLEGISSIERIQLPLACSIILQPTTLPSVPNNSNSNSNNSNSNWNTGLPKIRRSSVLWDITSRSPLEVNVRFEWKYRPHLQCRRIGLRREWRGSGSKHSSVHVL
jgi:hypothetical protein